MALFFIFIIVSSLIIPLVSFVKGQWQVIISLSFNNSSSVTNLTVFSSPLSFGRGAYASTFISNASASFATFCPIAPNPIIPIVFPASSASGAFQKQKSGQLHHSPL